MKKKTYTLAEVTSMGGKAQKKKYSTKQLTAWGKMGGRPRKTVKA
jgi:hypothetical protein